MQTLNKTFDIVLNTMFQGTHSTRIFVNQGDTRSVIFNFRVYEDTKKLDYNLVKDARLFLVKPDGHVVQQTLQPQGSEDYTTLISQQALTTVGTVTGAVALYGHENERITTLSFTFLVGADILSRHIVESLTEFDALQRAIALLEGAIRLYEEFPRLNILGYFEFESELLAAFPDGSNLNGGFWVGSECEGRYFFWDRTHNRWKGIDPNRGRTGRHFIPISEPSTAQQLHDMGVRVGDSIVVLSEVETPFLFVAGEDRVMGTVLERVHEAVADSSFVERRSIRGARGEPGTNNPRGHWSAEIDDYQRYDTVIFRIDTGYAVFMYTSWETGLQIPPMPESPNNPWQLWIYPGLKGDAATIQIGEITMLSAGSKADIRNSGTLYNAVFDIDLPSSPTIKIGEVNTVLPDSSVTVTNSGNEYDVKLDFDIPQGKAATIEVGEVTTGLPNTPVIVENVGTAGEAVFNFSIPQGKQGNTDGTMFHAELNNLEFENSGHTGFASAVEISDIEQRIDTLITGIEMPPNANLNDYWEPGNYFVRTDLASHTIQNRPPSVNSAFALSVAPWGIPTANAPRVTQTIVPRLNNGVFVRTGTEQPSVFNQWRRVSTVDTLDAFNECLLQEGWRLFQSSVSLIWATLGWAISVN